MWLCWVYDLITNLAPLRVHAALAHARSVLTSSSSLGHRSRALARPLAGGPSHARRWLVSDYYDNAHFIVTLGLLGWLWWARADIYRPLRNTLVLVNLLAFVVFWRFPVAPPRMLRGFTDVVAASGRDRLLARPARSPPTPTSSPRCRPCTSPGRSGARSPCGGHTAAWLRALAVVYPFVTAFAVLSTGNHFVLDLAGRAARRSPSRGDRARWTRVRARRWRASRPCCGGARSGPTETSENGSAARTCGTPDRCHKRCYEVLYRIDWQRRQRGARGSIFDGPASGHAPGPSRL